MKDKKNLFYKQKNKYTHLRKECLERPINPQVYVFGIWEKARVLANQIGQTQSQS